MTSHDSSDLETTEPVMEDGGIPNALQMLKEASPCLEAMPLDILWEIFSKATPLDLLHLSWVSKDFNSILISKASRPIWMESRLSFTDVPDLPICPPDLSEIRYANLMFKTHCDYCLEPPTDDPLKEFITDFESRIRICLVCLDSNTASSSVDFLNREGKFITRKAIHYLARERARTKESLDHITFISDRLPKLRVERNKRLVERGYASKCQRFHNQWTLVARKRAVVEYVKSLGWSEEMSLITKASQKIEDRQELEAYYKFDMTPSVLKTLDGFFNDHMERLRDARFARVRRSRVNGATPALIQVLINLAADLPRDTLTPRIGDIILYPVVQDIIHGNPQGHRFTEDDFAPLQSAFSEILAQTVRDREAKLIAMITEKYGENLFDPATVLQLATTIFRCRLCNPHSEPMRYPQVLVHDHAYTDRDIHTATVPDEHPDSAALRAVWHRGCWNVTNNIVFRKQDVDMLSDILTQLGFDPLSTTKEEMDAKELILECVSCAEKQWPNARRWKWNSQHDDSNKQELAKYFETHYTVGTSHPPLKRSWTVPLRTTLSLYNVDMRELKECEYCHFQMRSPDQMSIRLKEVVDDTTQATADDSIPAHTQAGEGSGEAVPEAEG